MDSAANIIGEYKFKLSVNPHRPTILEDSKFYDPAGKIEDYGGRGSPV
jgi:hypothetical protein